MALLNADQKEHLEDWEFVLCDKSKLEAAPFLAGLQRCFCRVEAFLTETAEAIKRLSVPSLMAALQSRHMQQFDMSTFCRVFLLRYSDRLESADKDFLQAKEAELCQVSVAAKEAAALRRARAFVEVQAFFA